MESSPNMIFFLKDFGLNAFITGYFVYNKVKKQLCGISGLGDISAIIVACHSPGSLNLIPGILIVEKENQLLKVPL